MVNSRPISLSLSLSLVKQTGVTVFPTHIGVATGVWWGQLGQLSPTLSRLGPEIRVNLLSFHECSRPGGGAKSIDVRRYDTTVSNIVAFHKTVSVLECSATKIDVTVQLVGASPHTPPSLPLNPIGGLPCPQPPHPSDATANAWHEQSISSIFKVSKVVITPGR